MTTPLIVPVILAGGSGSRLWPLSRGSYPKQFLKLVGTHSLLQETVLRSHQIPGTVAPLILTHHEHFFICQDQLHDIQQHQAFYIIEPYSRNTAPAIAMAAHHIKKEFGPQTKMLIMPSDHLISDPIKLNQAIQSLLPFVDQGKLAILGIQPTAAKTGYGYIQAGEVLSPDCYEVSAFHEKPTEAKAQLYLAQKNYYWNAGMFLFQAQAFLEELKTQAPAIAQTTLNAYEASQYTSNFLRIHPDLFVICPEDSIDYAVMEKTKHSIMYKLQTGWTDLGSWTSVAEANSIDSDGNVKKGPVITKDTENCLISSEDDRLIAVIGLKNQVIISTADAVLIADKNHTEEVKQLVKELQLSKNPVATHHKKVYRPWGYYENLLEGPGFKVKQIIVKPGAQLSLQYHHQRSEHWTVVEGMAQVINGESSFTLNTNESTYIPIGEKHRLSNSGSIPLRVIEVQVGAYLGEDDIVRLQDVYERQLS